MSRRNLTHRIIETRDWAKIALAGGLGIAAIILALNGDLSAAALAAAAGSIR